VRNVFARFADPRFGLRLAFLLVVPVLSSVGCATGLPATPSASPIQAPVPEVASDAWTDRGRLVEQAAFEPPLEDPESVIGQSWRAIYTSASGLDGTSREVSGAFFVPRGKPPAGGWPVVSLAHGTTGVEPGCGPATEPSLGGYLPTVRAFLEQGYAVAFTDYEGLGRPGMHPYLEPRSAAFNIIDAVRALRELAPTVSTRWIAYGASQGGQATWAANELNPYYGDGLELLGSVAVSPAANVTGLADLAWEGSLTTEQERYYPLVIAGIERYNRDLRPGAYLHGRVAADMGALAKCASPVDGFLTRMEASSDLKPNTIQDTDRLRDALRKVALPQRRLDQPMMVTNGTDDEIILPQWVSSSVSLSCQMGGRIEYLEIPDAGHTDLTPDADAAVQRWIADRFAGAAAPSNCAASQ
jgi:dienelactone hydrolase